MFSAKVGGKLLEVWKQARTVPVFLVAVFALVAVATAPQARPKETVPFEDTAIRIETNQTDGDAGIQIFLDGEGWDSLKVYDPNGKQILHFRGKASVGMQGITELFFESAEPSFDEQTLEELFALFPEGQYRFEGKTTEGDKLTGMAELTHDLPCGPGLGAPDGDDSVDPNSDLTITWTPSLGHLVQVDDSVECVPNDVTVVGYEVIVENGGHTYDITLPATATSVVVPAAFLMPGTEYSFEVLAIEESGNQTISQGEFETEDEEPE